MYFKVDDIPADHRHPEQARFEACLRAVDFAARYDALCAAHPRRGDDVPVVARLGALRATGRNWYYDKRFRFYALREHERHPALCAVGLDARIDARVELALLFVTPGGLLSAPFARLARDVRRLTDPEFSYRPANPAPRVGSLDELPFILTASLALYDVLSGALRGAGPWWRPAPDEGVVAGAVDTPRDRRREDRPAQDLR